MTHPQQQIRDAVATILKRNPVNWKEVFQTRVDSKRQVWPYLKVYFPDEDAEPSTVNDPCVYSNSPVLIVAAMLLLSGTGDAHTQSIEDKMDDVDAEIKTKLTQSALREIVPKVHSFSYFRTEKDVVYEDFEGGVDHAVVITLWRVSYATLEGSPGSLI